MCVLLNEDLNNDWWYTAHDQEEYLVWQLQVLCSNRGVWIGTVGRAQSIFEVQEESLPPFGEFDLDGKNGTLGAHLPVSLMVVSVHDIQFPPEQKPHVTWSDNGK